MPGEEGVGLGPGEDPGGGADGPDATGTDGAGQAQAAQFLEPI
jgi:hypothetical protein